MIFIMRGIPGSGKSYHAEALKRDAGYPHAEIFSADQFFLRDGVYTFNPTAIGLAHQSCFSRFYEAADGGHDEVLLIVDNTNIRLWECSPYVLAGEAAGHSVELVHVKCDVEKAIARNTHGVPESVIRRMAQSMEAPLPHWNQREIDNS
jgi:tRNA uridine 5-carbamoylmethylation protein Kti12